MNKKIKPNKYRPEAKSDEVIQSDAVPGIDFCLKCIITIAFVSILSLSLIFAYDFITQSDYLSIKSIEISGSKRVSNDAIIELAQLSDKKNIMDINLFSIEKQIASHPWIESASVKRTLSCMICIAVVEHEPLAIVKIENLADILINIHGRPFKEYNPLKDHLENLPVISGLDLTQKNDRYLFDGPLFNSIMNYLKSGISGHTGWITGDKNTGVSIKTLNIYESQSPEDSAPVIVKLGFADFEAKLNRAKKICKYIDKNFPERTILAMDLFNIEKVFIKTELNDALHNNLKKGA